MKFGKTLPKIIISKYTHLNFLVMFKTEDGRLWNLLKLNPSNHWTKLLFLKIAVSTVFSFHQALKAYFSPKWIHNFLPSTLILWNFVRTCINLKFTQLKKSVSRKKWSCHKEKVQFWSLSTQLTLNASWHLTSEISVNKVGISSQNWNNY